MGWAAPVSSQEYDAGASADLRSLPSAAGTLGSQVGGRHGRWFRATSTLDVLHTLSLALLNLHNSLDLLIYCFSMRCSLQNCWALSCSPGGGET